MPAFTVAELKRELARAKANGLFGLASTAAKAHGIELAWLLGLWSRETNITNETGDGGHGHGPGQVDDRSHTIPGTLFGLADMSAAVARECLDFAATHYPHYVGDQRLKIAADDYNAGPRGVRRGMAAGDVDAGSTGHDYGSDVVKRTVVFRSLLP
jgi:hypothetical protein